MSLGTSPATWSPVACLLFGIALLGCSSERDTERNSLDVGSTESSYVVETGRPTSADSEGPCAAIECGPRAECVEESGEAHCACLAGFTGEDCAENVNECAETSDLCGAVGGCFDTFGGYGCECADSAEYSAASCQDVDECDTANPCAAGAACEDTGATVECTCPSGTFGNGRFCLDADPCAGVDCGEGSCAPSVSGPVCLCPLGRSGASCEVDCSEVTFADADLETALAASFGLSTPIDAALVEDGSFSLSDSSSVGFLSGLECLSGMTSVTLRKYEGEVAPLFALTRLEELDLGCRSSFETAPLEGLPSLRRLFLDHGDDCSVQGWLSDASVLSQLSGLEELALSRQPLASLAPLTALRSLRMLVLRGVDVELSPLASMPSLRRLDLSEVAEARVRAVLPSLGKLTRLALRNVGLNSIEALEFPTTLRELDLGSNALSTLAHTTFPSGLFWLDLSSNDLTSLEGLEVPASLRFLDLWDNPFVSLAALEEASLPQGLEIWLQSGTLDCSAIAATRKLLWEHGVSVVSDCP